MVKLSEIKRNGDWVEVMVHSIDLKPPQLYKMVFNYKTREYKCSLENADPFDIHHVMYKLAGYINANQELPVQDAIIWG